MKKLLGLSIAALILATSASAHAGEQVKKTSGAKKQGHVFFKTEDAAKTDAKDMQNIQPAAGGDVTPKSEPSVDTESLIKLPRK